MAAADLTVPPTSAATDEAVEIQEFNSSVPVTASTATDEALEVQEFDSSLRFDIVSDDSDHYFADPRRHRPDEGQFPPEAHKRIMHEWKLLKEGLPESITVRAYEKRVDLLRAAIVGAEGTPYHDGLYFFDFAFPEDYPKQPPKVNYRSFGHHINPNLYEDGYVCLSLLNTWDGEKSEMWNPEESTVLQILLSLQALVLNEEPYYNEPDETLSEARSLSYNDEVFVLSCKTMLCLMRKPPKGFEGLVASHFQERARRILSACESYANGQARVGHFKSGGIDGEGSSCSSSKSAAAGSKKVEEFRASVRTVYPVLFAAFCEKGAQLDGITERLPGATSKFNGVEGVND